MAGGQRMVGTNRVLRRHRKRRVEAGGRDFRREQPGVATEGQVLKRRATVVQGEVTSLAGVQVQYEMKYVVLLQVSLRALQDALPVQQRSDS